MSSLRNATSGPSSRQETASVVDLRAGRRSDQATAESPRHGNVPWTRPHDFASRTFFTRRRSTEKIPGLPAASDAFADGGGGHLADIMALSEAPVLPSSHATNRHEAVGVGLPAHSAAMTVEITSGRITAQNLIAALGWKQSQELWAYLNAAGFWELVAERPTDGLALQARVMSRGRTQLAADTRKAMGIEDGDTLLAIATEQNTLALIPLQELTLGRKPCTTKSQSTS